jgi:hypothetical protein
VKAVRWTVGLVATGVIVGGVVAGVGVACTVRWACAVWGPCWR